MTRMNINFFLHDEDATEFEAGDTIFNMGDTGEVMYGIQSGTVELIYRDEVIASLDAGDIFGEMALADKSTRSAAAVAKTDCKLSVIDNASFLTKIQHQPIFALFMIQTIVERLRRETVRGR